MSLSDMESRAEAYLSLRRRLGSALQEQGRLLLRFARYADGTGHQGPITTELAVRWAKLPENAAPLYWGRRLEVVRGFARHEVARDPRTEVPAVNLLGPSYRRVQPHIYSCDEIGELLHAAAALAPVGGLRPSTYATLFGLLAATGLRVSEAARLTQADVDLRSAVVRVSETKFHKSRLVPLHSSTTSALEAYAEQRDRRYPPLPAKAFFLSRRGRPLKYRTIDDTFVELRRGLRWVCRGGRPAPRIHDLRHTFACRRLLAWYEEGGDINLKLPALSTYLGHVQVSDTYWYLTAIPDLMAVASARFERPRGRSTMTPSPTFPSLVQDFFVQRLMNQANASARTVASYRDTLCLLLRHAEQAGKPPTALTLADLDAPFTLAFLDHLEKQRGNSVRTRNLRLAAIRSFLHYAALRDPTGLPSIQRVLAIPLKRFDRPQLGFLSREEMETVLAAPDLSTWSGQRDQAMLATLYNTGARVSEIAAVRIMDAQLDRNLSLRIRGKGRKERTVPLWKKTAITLKAWRTRLNLPPEGPLFPNRDAKPLSRFGVVKRLRVAVQAAAQRCPALKDRRVSPHTLRHTTAMHLLQSGVDIALIALWLGHESPATTHLYVEADLDMKRKALTKLPAPTTGSARFRTTDRLLAFLDGL